MTAPAYFGTGYFDIALMDLTGVLDQAERNLAGVDFNTIVGTGFSGAVVIPALALRMGKLFALVRKEADDSHHGSGKLVGQLGDRWIFVDDFVSSGATRNRVIAKVEAGAKLQDRETTLVGEYMYGRYVSRWMPELGAYEEGYGIWTPVPLRPRPLHGPRGSSIETEEVSPF